MNMLEKLERAAAYHEGEAARYRSAVQTITHLETTRAQLDLPKTIKGAIAHRNGNGNGKEESVIHGAGTLVIADAPAARVSARTAKLQYLATKILYEHARDNDGISKTDLLARLRTAGIRFKGTQDKDLYRSLKGYVRVTGAAATTRYHFTKLALAPGDRSKPARGSGKSKPVGKPAENGGAAMRLAIANFFKAHEGWAPLPALSAHVTKETGKGVTGIANLIKAGQLKARGKGGKREYALA